MKVAYPFLLIGLMAASGAAFSAQAADKPFLKLTGEASVATAGMTKGASDTNGDPQGLIGLKVSHGVWFAGALVSPASRHGKLGVQLPHQPAVLVGEGGRGDLGHLVAKS